MSATQSQDIETAPAAQVGFSPMPDLGDIIFILIMQLLVFTLPNFEFGDGSTGWHLAAGQFILNNHAVPTKDIISYTHPDAPWVAYEWLSDLLMAAVAAIAGLNGLNIVIAALIALLFLLIYRRCRTLGCHFLIALPLVICGALVSTVHWLARPHIFTFFGLYIFSTTLEDFHRGVISQKRMLLTLALCMLLWANLHPAFLIGFVLIAMYIAAELMVAVAHGPGPLRAAPLQRSKALALALLATIAASMLNPYGPQLYVYIANYLHGGTILAATAEFQPPHFGGGLQPACLELLLGASVLGMAMQRQSCSFPQILMFFAFAHLALSAVRNTPLFAIVAVPFAAELLSRSRLLPADSPNKVLNELSTRWRKVGDEFGEIETQCRLHILPLLYVIAMLALAMSGSPLVKSGFDSKHMPTATLAYIQEQHLDPRGGFNYDNWGGYIRYATGMPVFIDDRADFYGEKFYLEYARVSMVEPGWSDVLKKYNIQWVLFPNNSRLVARLSESPEWKVVKKDDAASLLERVK